VLFANFYRKVHASIGNLLGLYIIDATEDAINDLSQHEGDLATHLQELLDKEEARYQRIMASDITAPGMLLESVFPPDAKDKGVHVEDLFKKKGICHTALLPSQTRYLGILTETNQTGMLGHYEGIPEGEINDPKHDTSEIKLMQTANDREYCEVPVNIDHKDGFYLHYSEGEKSMIIPNNAELTHYVRPDEPLLGIVAVCMTSCRKCSPALIQAGDLLPYVSIFINDVEAKGTHPWGKCVFLSNEDGFHFPADSQGKFNIRMTVFAQDRYLVLSSVMIW
jgi:hypothetical protein